MPRLVGACRAGEGKISRGVANCLCIDLKSTPPYNEALPFQALRFILVSPRWAITSLQGLEVRSVLETSREQG